jgi:hypothetical protein
MYYHMYLDTTSLEILRKHATKLVVLAETLHSWNDSEYGLLFRFCDSITFSKVVQIWRGYTDADRKAQVDFNAKFRSDLKKSADAGTNLMGTGFKLAAFRSGSPAALDTMQELPRLQSEYLKHGTTGGIQAKKPNPMFNSNGTLHYSLDPLLGFHLAPAYIPLVDTSPFKASAKSKHKVVETARLEFKAWSEAFKHCAKNLVFRFFAGDALSFCQTLQNIGHTKNNTAASCYRSQNSSEPLLLDSADYINGGNSPLMFDAIDTSNLVDHLGPLNILMAASPLLENKTYATLFTETLVQQEDNHFDTINNLLCGEFSSMSTLLGLIPVEYFTKATPTSSTHETMINAMNADSNDNISRKGKNQKLMRMNWKRTLSSSNSVGVVSLCFDPSSLASILHKVYLTMFRHENGAVEFLNGAYQVVAHKMISSRIEHYHRGSFANLVQLVKSRVSADWNLVMHHLFNSIENDTNLIIGRNYLQELYLCMHLYGVHTVGVLKQVPNVPRGLYSMEASQWKTLPPIVCITLKVPKSQLKIFTDRPAWKTGVHTLNCSLTDSSRWQNDYSVLQFCFGKLTSIGQRGTPDFKVCIEEDAKGWHGSSPLLVSFLTPSWMLLQAAQSPMVSLCLQISPQSVAMFSSTLGLHLKIYQTSLSNEESVFVAADWPHLRPSILAPRGFSHLVPSPSPEGKEIALVKVTAHVDAQTHNITALASRADIISDVVKAALQHGGKVKIEQTSPFQSILTISDEHRILLDFPMPVVSSSAKTRIARKSSYVEIIAPLLKATDFNSFPTFMHHMLLEGGLPVLYNMPRVDLDGMAVVDITQPSKLGWLQTHISLMWSEREKALKMESFPSPDLRVNFKEGLFSLFMMFARAHDCEKQIDRSRIFGINDPKNGGIHMVIIVSSLRLDGANGTAVLDAAVIPLTPSVASKTGPWITSLAPYDVIVNIKVDAEEMALWKILLPGYAERCRTWSHKASCEYTRQNAIPVSLKFGTSPLCSCGNGIFPANFMQDHNNRKNLPGWSKFANYAVRVAISPTFSVPIVEEQVGATLLKPHMTNEQSLSKNSKLDALSKIIGDKEKMAAFMEAFARQRNDHGDLSNEIEFMEKVVQDQIKGDKEGCEKCGKSKEEVGKALMRCARCRKVKYCSAECQKADWKGHKMRCVKE